MEAYRDQYATIFNNGRGIVLVGISADADTTLAAWARESSFPMLFASDTSGHVGTLYGAFDPARRVAARGSTPATAAACTATARSRRIAERGSVMREKNRPGGGRGDGSFVGRRWR